jgi:Icc protein
MSSAHPEKIVIAQVSDIHCGDPRFDRALMQTCIDTVNSHSPDLFVLAGDLTVNGYRDEYEEAMEYLSLFACPRKLVIAGNHDCRNVGFLHFEELVGLRSHAASFHHPAAAAGGGDGEVKVVCVDSNKPDLDDGDIGRQKYFYIRGEFAENDAFRILVLHHHLVTIPGTGRERNIVLDAGDVLQLLSELEVDLVLSGHKHVPWTWPVAGMYLVTSGTASTRRTRGFTPPSFNLIEVDGDRVAVSMVSSLDGSHTATVYPRRHAVCMQLDT